jgi:predicted ATPase
MLKKLFARGSAAEQKEIIVVSGLPRSGTSMMMKMLAEGGLQTVTDSLRTADDDNPNGYFEFEPVKQMTEGNVNWLDEARGKVVKVISALLEHLPSKYHYKVIFMERPLPEVLASQKKMLVNRSEASAISDAEMEEQFRKHLGAIKYWLARQPNIEVMYMDYGKMLAAPETYCNTLAGFLDIPVDVAKMQTVPNEKLYRNRVVK